MRVTASLSPSDFMLWGTSTPGKLAGKRGRKLVASPVTMTTRIGKKRPSIHIRLQWPWFVKMGVQLGDKLTFGWCVDGGDIEKGQRIYIGWLKKTEPGERGHKLIPMSGCRHGIVTVPLDDLLPFMPAATPMTVYDDQDGEYGITFTIREGPLTENVYTVGDAIRETTP